MSTAISQREIAPPPSVVSDSRLVVRGDKRRGGRGDFDYDGIFEANYAEGLQGGFKPWQAKLWAEEQTQRAFYAEHGRPAFLADGVVGEPAL